MSPLYPLRVIFLSLISLGILAGAIFCLWVWGDRVFNHRDHVAQEPVVRRDSEVDIVETPPIRKETIVRTTQVRSSKRFADDLPTWVFLVGGLSLTFLSFGGAIPAKLLFGKVKSDTLKPHRGERITIERPDGSCLRVESYGGKSLPTLVLTHGWSLDNTDWHYAKEQLGKKFRLVVWDLPGLGGSTQATNKDQSLEKMANDLNAVVERTSGNQPVYLLGHSIGGMISQVYARRYAEKLVSKVKGIVLVNTTYKNPLTTITGAPIFTALQWPVLVPLNYLVILFAPFFWLSNWKSFLNGSLQTSSRFSSFTGSQSWSQLNHASLLSAKAWPAVVARGNYAMTQFDEEDSLPYLKIPLLVVAGEHDRITKKSASERIHQLVPNSELVVLPGGHQQLYEFHDIVMESIAEFLDRVEKKATRSLADQTQ